MLGADIDGDVREPGDITAGARQALTKPLPTGSVTGPMTMGIVAVAFCAAVVACVPAARITSTFSADQFRRQFQQSPEFSVGKAPLDREVFPPAIAKFSHAVRERPENVGIERIRAALR